MYGKRFTHNKQWLTPRFRKLDVNHKLVYLYMIDHVDWAGFMQLDEERIAFDTGVKLEVVSDVLQKLNEDEIVMHDDIIFFIDFIEEQKNTPLNPKDNSHKPIIKSLEQNKSTIKECLRIKNNLDPHMTLLRPSGNGKAIGKSNSIGNGLKIWNRSFDCQTCGTKEGEECQFNGECKFPQNLK